MDRVEKRSVSAAALLVDDRTWQDHGATMLPAKAWKAFYAQERERLGARAIDQLLDRAEEIPFPAGGALIFPHTRLAESGHLIAAVAKAVVESGADTVLALGVLHGAREQDAQRVNAARAGDAAAIEALRGAHGPGVAGDGGLWAEEFSLDNFAMLLRRRDVQEKNHRG